MDGINLYNDLIVDFGLVWVHLPHAYEHALVYIAYIKRGKKLRYVSIEEEGRDLVGVSDSKLPPAFPNANEINVLCTVLSEQTCISSTKMRTSLTPSSLSGLDER
eukprot:166427_1